MLIKELFTITVKKKASDLHLVVGSLPFLRIDGELEEIKGQKILTKKDMEEIVYGLLTEEQKNRFLKYKELDLSVENDNGDRFRVNLHFEKNNIGLVARLINNKIPTLDEIGMPKIVYDLLKLKQGLILVTGPTGCGKSTTLASMVNYINENQKCNIITLEDPIEYIFKPKQSIIVQRQLGSDMVSFTEGLKHALRQDPNVIMVGEMRDLETIATAITLAETGHLVLATLHTYSAAQTIDRMIDIFPPYQQTQIRMQLSITLAAVISQRLVIKIKGGRIAVREILLNTPATSNLIRENKIAQIKTVIETSAKEGMISLDRNLEKLYKDKIITKEVAQSQMENPEILDKFRSL
ncbi:MAG: type IV pilus twitching motility protein PilT [Patescibacteria group bacterium]